MDTGYLYDALFLEHNMPDHPECRERLTTIMAYLESAGLLARLVPLPARPVEPAVLNQVHSPDFTEMIRSLSLFGGSALDPDTYVTPASFDAARLAAGASVEAVSAVLRGRVRNAFALVRPPGHHARPDQGMGFCLFNNIAIAARFALQQGGLRRVLIVDFDVHHGNGTQEVFWEDPSVLFCSTHQFPYYPGTGYWREIGAGAGLGYTINVPLAFGAGDPSFEAAFSQLLLPAARRFAPELILVSAGFDAHWADPLASLNLSLAGYARLCQQLFNLAEELCDGRLVFLLEGGYNLEVLPIAVANVFHILLGDPPACLSDPLGTILEHPDDGLPVRIERLRALHQLGSP